MTKAQEVYEKVEALVASGVSKADAFKRLAGEYGQEVNSIRGAYYAHTSTLGGTPRSSRKRKSRRCPNRGIWRFRYGTAASLDRTCRTWLGTPD